MKRIQIPEYNTQHSFTTIFSIILLCFQNHQITYRLEKQHIIHKTVAKQRNIPTLPYEPVSIQEVVRILSGGLGRPGNHTLELNSAVLNIVDTKPTNSL